MLFFLLFLILLSCNPIETQEYYDSSNCTSKTSYPGSRYSCKMNKKSCSTYIVYRANHNFNTISNISHLFQVDVKQLLHSNNLLSASQILKPGMEIVIPVTCFCLDHFFRVINVTYTVLDTTPLPNIACDVFEGLVKSDTLFKENPSQENDFKIGFELNVPLRCACLENFSNEIITFLATYPLIEGDTINGIAQKFSVSTTDLLAANYFKQPWPTIYPQTTILIPLQLNPKINFNIPNSPPPSATFLPTITVQKKTSTTKLMTLYSLVSILGFVLLVVAAFVWYARKIKLQNIQSFNTRSSRHSCSTLQTARSSATSCLSPDMLVGIKFSLKNYSVEDLKRATKDFSEETKIGIQTYKGLIDKDEFMMIKQMKFEDTHQVIDIHSKINHINIVSMVGVCYGEEQNENSWSYLVFELPTNGCLRDCLNNLSSSLQWHRRIQIAVDIARGLHYLHYCIFPSYAHNGVNSKNIFITANWRAKLTDIRISTSSYRLDCHKEDIFAFGVVLLELISGREDENGKLFKEWIGFLGGGEGGCFEQLRSFIDPFLKDYQIADALCLAVLAKACVEDDPLHRPSTDDVLKVLVRLV